MSLDEIKATLCGRALDVAVYLFPQGMRSGSEWQCGDVLGNPGASFSIRIEGAKAGMWADFSTGEKGTMLDLWAMHFGYHGVEGWVTKAAEEASQWLGGTFEKRSKDGAAPLPRSTSKPATSGKPAAKPVLQQPAPRPQPNKPLPKMPSYAEEWQAAVRAFDGAAASSIARSRGYSVEFVEWLHREQLVGIVTTRHGKAFALAVHDEQGAVIAAHVRNPQKNQDGSPIEPAPHKWEYRYNGETSPGTRPLILGDVKKATKIWVFESQWDAFAVMDRLGFHHDTAEWPHIAIFITRGASNARLLQPIIGEGKTLVLWPQNDQPTAAGKVPAEEWVTAILEIASGSMPVRRVDTPKGYEDANAWLKACPMPVGLPEGEWLTENCVDAGKLVECVSQARPARPNKLPLLRDMAVAIQPQNRLTKPPEVICGIARRGDKITIGAPSKGRKTWTLADLAISVATGSDWWGLKTVQGRVLYLNFELHNYTFDERVDVLQEAKNTKIQVGMMLSMTIRGMTDVIDSMVDELIAYILDLEPFALIVVDPLYKLMTGRDENKAGDMNMTLAQLEKIAVNTGAAIAIATHFSKGNQAGKDHMDRIGGSGVIGRDGDVIITMTENETPDAMTISLSLRSYAPVEPFAVRWEYPLFSPDTSIDPAALKQPTKKGERQDSYASRIPREPKARSNDALKPALRMLREVYGNAMPRAFRWGELTDKAMKACFKADGTNISETSAKKYAWLLKEKGYIVKKDSAWVTTQAGDALCDEGSGSEESEPEPEPNPEPTQLELPKP